MAVDVVGLFEILVSGIARGLILALLGAGITMVFGLGGVLNLAIGVFTVVAVIVGGEFLAIVPNPWIAATGTLLFMSVMSLGIDRSLLSLIYRSDGEERTLLGIFATLGLALFIEGFLFIYYPSGYSFGVSFDTVELGPAILRGSTLAIILLSAVVVVALYGFLNRTYVGNATQTVLQDEKGAVLCGIEPRRIYTLVFVLSAVIASIAGLMFSLNASVAAADALGFTIEAVIVSIVGGVTSIRGTIAAGLLLGIVITFANFLIGAYIAQLILFTIAIAALLLEPDQIV